MQFILKTYKLFLVILAFWFLINWNLRIETIIFGLIAALIVTIASKDVLYNDKGFIYKGIKLHRLLVYMFFLLVEIFKSTFIYISAVISGKYEPVLLKIKLDLDDAVQIGIIANSITLTPGTISVDVVGSTILVITLAKPGTNPKDLEKPIHENFERLLLTKAGKKRA
ncbi:MAG: Na+/H+ antiporter subunit E [Acholeplasma sp.]